MLGSRHKGCSLFNAGKSNRASIEGCEESMEPYGRGRLLAGMLSVVHHLDCSTVAQRDLASSVCLA